MRVNWPSFFGGGKPRRPSRFRSPWCARGPGRTLRIKDDIRLIFAYRGEVFDPDAHLPRLNKGLVYLGACLIAGIRMARAQQVNIQVRPTAVAIEESVDLAHEIYNRVFRKVPEKIDKRTG